MSSSTGLSSHRKLTMLAAVSAAAPVFFLAASFTRAIAAPAAGSAARIHEILSANCFRCHGKEGSAEGGMNFILRRDKLLAANYVVPNQPGQSPLVDRLTSTDDPMPPAGENPRPSADDIKTIIDWIQSGAPEFAETRKPSFISNEVIYKGLRADLAKLNKNDTNYMRYFSVMHLRTSGLADDEIATYRLALAKLLNSLSWNRKLLALTPVDKYNTIFRIDLRDLKWTPAIWESISAAYPYVQIVDTLEALGCRTVTECDVPLIRGDWFVAAASRPPLYHQLLQLPDTDIALENLLKVDVARDINERTCVRAAFARSGVSQNNRMIERHESIFGAYWKSYDFASSSGDKNLFEHPTGPGGTDGFRHDGGEIIFTLPNGMLGFMLVDAFGHRVDRGPATIVSDPRQPDRAVVNGASCMTCHYAGVIRKADEIRPHVEANRGAFADSDMILALYPAHATTDNLLQRDAKSYQNVLGGKEIGITRLSNSGEPISVVAERYRDDVTSAAAAAELGVDEANLTTILGRLKTQDLVRAAGPLRSGGSVKRDSFEDAFPDLVTELNLGSTAMLAQQPAGTPRRITPSNVAPRQARKAAEQQQVATNQQIASALEQFEAGRKANLKGDKKEAQAKFEEAIRIAPDDAFRIRVYEQLLPFYERQATVDKLVEAHRYIINAAQGEGAQQQAIDAFFRTIASHTKGTYVERNVPPVTMWNNAKVPVSTATVITSQFEQDLANKPGNEATLRVLAIVYRFIAPNEGRRREILEQLQAAVTARRGKLDVIFQADLAALYVSAGEPAKGAALYEEVLQGNSRDSSFAPIYIDLADAWQKAGDRNKALAALEQAEKLLTSSAARTNALAEFQLVRLGDAYLNLEANDKAAKIYRLALTNNKSSYRTEELQQKLALALSENGAATEGGEPTEKLLDPNRRFRQEAEQLQTSKGFDGRTSPSDLIRATENWIKAGDNDKALVTAKQAETELRKRIRVQLDDRHARHDDDFARLADLYRKLGQPKLAIPLLIEALKLSTEEHDIERHQQKLSALTADSTVDSTAVDDALKKLLDENYKYRAVATHLEKDEGRNASDGVQNLIESGRLWLKAGDENAARRVARLAAERMKRATGPGRSVDRAHSELSGLYVSLGDPKTAADELVQAINTADSEYQAKDYQEELTELCEQNNLPVPELGARAAKKLDPLTKFRERAEEAENRAKGSTVGKSRQLLEAAENWLQAEEKEKALANLKKAAAETRRSRGGRAGNDYEKLAELFAQAGDTKSAKQYYKLAIDNTTSKFRKKDLQETLDNLNDPAGE